MDMYITSINTIPVYNRFRQNQINCNPGEGSVLCLVILGRIHNHIMVVINIHDFPESVSGQLKIIA